MSPEEDRTAALAAVRDEIDRLDERIIAGLSERERLVRRAGALKTSEAAVRAPARVEQVIARARATAQRHGADPAVAEVVYRAMITAFIELELRVSRVAASDVGPPPPADSSREV